MLTLTLFDLFSHIAVYQMDTGETIVERLYISTSINHRHICKIHLCMIDSRYNLILHKNDFRGLIKVPQNYKNRKCQNKV